LSLDIDEKVAASFAIKDAWQVGFVTARIFFVSAGKNDGAIRAR
jgi:hypothetical protein